MVKDGVDTNTLAFVVSIHLKICSNRVFLPYKLTSLIQYQRVLCEICILLYKQFLETETHTPLRENRRNRTVFLYPPWKHHALYQAYYVLTVCTLALHEIVCLLLRSNHHNALLQNGIKEFCFLQPAYLAFCKLCDPRRTCVKFIGQSVEKFPVCQCGTGTMRGQMEFYLSADICTCTVNKVTDSFSSLFYVTSLMHGKALINL